MNTRSVDENILAGQRRLPQKWNIPFRQIGVEIGRKGMDVAQPEAAHFIRRVLRHPDFDTHAKRMGVVIRASQSGLNVWRRKAEHEAHSDWKV